MFQVHSMDAQQLNAMLCSQQHKLSCRTTLLVLLGVTLPGMWHVRACTPNVLGGDAGPRTCVRVSLSSGSQDAALGPVAVTSRHNVDSWTPRSGGMNDCRGCDIVDSVAAAAW